MRAAAPEPKPIFIGLVILAGIFGCALFPLIRHLTDPASMPLWKLPYFTKVWAFTGAAIGLAVGVSLAITERFWLRLALAPLFGILAFQAAGRLRDVVFLPGTGIPFFSFDVYYAVDLALPAATLIMLAHHAGLRFKINPTFYILGGIAFCVLFWFEERNVYGLNAFADSWLQAVLLGAVFGSFQYLALFSARWVDSKTRRHVTVQTDETEQTV
jgi:hypothetical protein